MLQDSVLLEGAATLLVCYHPTNPEKLGYWATLCKALKAVCPGTRITAARFEDRLAAVQAVTGRDITAEALTAVAGDDEDKRRDAMSFGTSLSARLFTKQNSLLRSATTAFLKSEKCSTGSTAYVQFIKLCASGNSATWNVTDAFWQAMSGALSDGSAQCTRTHQQQQQRRAEAARQRQERERRQQQRQWQQQQRQQKHQQQRMVRGLLGELSAAAPDVAAMSAEELQVFLQKVGVADDATLGSQLSSQDREQLMQLAEQSLQLWEAKRIVNCGVHMAQHGSLSGGKLAIARMVLRLRAIEASGSESGGGVKAVYKTLALLVHPDKTPAGFQGFREVFEEGFKVLQQACEMLK